METNEKSVNYHVPALEKGLDILEALSAGDAPMSLADLARTLDRSSSELFRMADCLEKRGYIVKDELSGNYMLSLKLFQLAHMHSPIDQLLRVSVKPMKDLAQRVRESNHLSVLKDGTLIVLAQAESPDKVRLSIEVGSQSSIIHTVSGRLLLAHLPDDELASILADDKEYQLLNKTKQRKFTAALQEIREKGYSVSENESRLGIKDVGVLVGNPRTGPTAALAIAYLTAANEKDRSEHLLEALQACAKTINNAIGVGL